MGDLGVLRGIATNESTGRKLIVREVTNQLNQAGPGSSRTALDRAVGGSSAKKRLLIFVIAYYAESTLRRVLERIPLSVFQQYDCEVLVVDDGSEDRTFAIGREYKARHPAIRMMVLRNEYNQGYGGNQKVGCCIYRSAVDAALRPIQLR